jgi:Predicted membrane protein (DUF2207)/TPM domain
MARSASSDGGGAWPTWADAAGPRRAPEAQYPSSVPSRHTVIRLWFVAFVAVWLVAIPAAIRAADPEPTREAPVDQTIHDTAGLLDAGTIRTATLVADRIAEVTGLRMTIHAQRADNPTVAGSAARAEELLSMDPDVGLVLLVEQDPSGEPSTIAYAASPQFMEFIPEDALDRIMLDSVHPVLAAGELNSATIVAAARTLMEVTGELPGGPATDPGSPADAPPPGPPFPEPEIDRAVYDFAGVFSPETIAAVEATIDRIEERTGAEAVVYTQVADFRTTEETESNALALINQWGIGRKGFDDGLAIFFNFEPGRSSGQVQLYAAPGFAATYLTNSERQAIFENDMLPYLRADDWDAAILAAINRIDEVATPENAARLERGRQLNAAVGLMGAPLILAGLVGWGVFHWRRFGKDPVYLDSPSIYVPAPPPDLTAASGAMVLDGKTSRRALTTAMLDLASRGLIAFREESGILGFGRKVGIDLDPASGDEIVEAQRARNSRRPMSPAEQLALRRLRPIGTGNYIEPDELLKFGAAVDDFDAALEQHVVGQGWFAVAPSKTVSRWVVRGVLAIVGGAGVLILAFQIPMSGLALVGGALIIGGVFLLLLSRAMPAVTMPGAMIRAQLAAYRRTLKKTMEQSRSMDQVVADAGLEWLDTPDQAVVWGTALGLQDEIEQVLERSLEDVKEGRVASTGMYFPAWYGGSGGQGFANTGGGGGIFSSSGVPNLGGMMAALGTIGNSPASSSGGGGFGGGGGGGGGGGAGGGF